jgi:predicted RND superfamily exporter protein
MSIKKEQKLNMIKIANFIVKFRNVLLVIFVALITLSIFLIPKVDTNYNMLKYLDKDSESVLALNKMQEEFGSNGTAKVMVENVNEETALSIKNQLEEIEGVNSIVFDVKDSNNYKNNTALYTIFLTHSDFELESHETVTTIRNTLSNYDVSLSGQSVDSEYLQNAVSEDMLIILLIACLVILIILLISSTSWIDPLIFAIIVAGAILINLGTNILLGEVSYITKSICAIMQIALAMDYSIIVLHRYNEEKLLNNNNKEALANALAKCFSPVSASSLTTMAGLVALMFMRFTIGFDVGMVLAKGILISLISVFLFMPSLILLFAPLIEKTKHNSFSFKKHHEKIKEIVSKKIKNKSDFAAFQYKTRFIIPVILVIVIASGLFLQSNIDYSYTLETAKDSNASVNIEKQNIEEIYGIQNSLVVMVKKDDFVSQQKIIDYLTSYKYKNKNVITGGSGIINSGLYDNLSVLDAQNKFGITETEATDIFNSMGIALTDKITTYNLLEYLYNNEYATNSAIKNQQYIDDTYNKIAPLFIEVTADEFAENNGIDINFANKIFEMMNVSDKAPVYQIIDFISNNQAILTIAEQIIPDFLNNYTNINQMLAAVTLEQAKTIYSLKTEQATAIFNAINGEIPTATSTIQNYKLINFLYENQGATSLQDKYNAIQQAFTELSYNEVLTTYSVISEISLNAIYQNFGRNTETDKIKNYEIVLYVYNSQKIVDEIYNNSLTAFFDMTKEQVATNYSLPTDIINQIFVSLNLTDSIKTYQLINFLSENQTAISIGQTIQKKINENMSTAKFAKSLFESENYTRIFFNLELATASEDAFNVTEEIRTGINKISDNNYIVSESASFYDIKNVYNEDTTKINLISFFAIFLIILLTFKSISIPALLTVLIQGSIWITMSLNVVSGSQIFFVCYLVVMCIQMGATVDYAILMSSRYLDARATMNKKDSIRYAFKSSISTILTSGTILVIAAFIVGLVSKVSIISTLGLLLSRGCLISLLLIIFALPQTLLLCDKIMAKTTLGKKMLND